jgi:hypothetical protein
MDAIAASWHGASTVSYIFSATTLITSPFGGGHIRPFDNNAVVIGEGTTGCTVIPARRISPLGERGAAERMIDLESILPVGYCSEDHCLTAVSKSRPVDKTPFGCSIVTENHPDAHPADHCHPDAGVRPVCSGRGVVPVDNVLAGHRGDCRCHDRGVRPLIEVTLPPATALLHRPEDHRIGSGCRSVTSTR